MRKRNKIFIILIVIILVVNSMIIYAASNSEENELQITKTEAMKMASENSSVIRQLDASRTELLLQYADYNKQMGTMGQLYSLLPRYESLYQKDQVTKGNVNYLNYFLLSQQVALDAIRLPALDAELAELEQEKLTALPGEIPAIDAAIAVLEAERDVIELNQTNLATLAATFTPAQLSSIITPLEFQELEIYKAQFGAMGINGPASDQQEYETFIYPIYIASSSMATAVQSLGISIDSTKQSIMSAAGGLYDGIVSLEEVEAILSESYSMSLSSLEVKKSKYKVGTATEYDVQKAENDAEVAQLQLDKTQRDIDNMKMKLKKMLGVEATVELVLKVEKSKSTTLQDIEVYIQGALENRTEIKSLLLSIDSKEYEYDFIADYYHSTSKTYLISKSELEALKLELEYTKLNIEKELRNAYLDVQEKKEVFTICKEDLEQAKNQYNCISQYVDNGIMISSSLDSLNLQIIQKKNAYLSANRDYLKALKAIEDASNIGPAYPLY